MCVSPCPTGGAGLAVSCSNERRIDASPTQPRSQRDLLQPLPPVRACSAVRVGGAAERAGAGVGERFEMAAGGVPAAAAATRSPPPRAVASAAAAGPRAATETGTRQGFAVDCRGGRAKGAGVGNKLAELHKTNRRDRVERDPCSLLLATCYSLLFEL